MGITIDAQLAAARRRIRRLAPADALLALARGAALIDIRPAGQRARDGAVPGSFVASRNALEWRLCAESGWRDPRLPDRDGEPILFCDGGFASSLAAAGLVELGFARAAEVDGGFAAWRAAGLPIVPHDDPSVLPVLAGGPGSPLVARDPYDGVS